MQAIRNFTLLLSFTLLVSCAGLTFSQQSLDNTNKVSRDAIALINTGDNYSQHATEVDQLKATVLEIYQQEQLRKMNKSTVAMWNEVINGSGNLFDLLDKWKANNTLSPVVRTEGSRQVEKIFKSITDLENRKKKS